MYQGFYTIASGILMQERAISVLSNNLVNVNTPGYKASRLISTTFEEQLLRVENGKDVRIGTTVPITIVSEAPTRYDSDSLVQTDRPMDIAINGEGFFRIRAAAVQVNENPEDADATDFENAETAMTEEGAVYLTRNGNFDIDEEGFLVLRGVGRVLGRRGEIDLGGSSSFTVDANGEIYGANGQYIDTLDIVVPGEDESIERVGNSLFQFAGEATGRAAENSTLVQKWLEKSNLDMNREYTMMMEAQRAFQSCSTALQILDKVNQQAAAQIAAL